MRQLHCAVCHRVWMHEGKVFAFRGARRGGELVWAVLLTEEPSESSHTACSLTCASTALQQAFAHGTLVEAVPFWDVAKRPRSGKRV